MATTITTFTDMAPTPRVRLDIDPAALAVGTITVTVYQLSKWGQVAVRDWTRRAVASGLIVDDYEVPPGVPVNYKVEQFNAGGVSLGFAALTLATQINLPRSTVIIQDPLAPANALAVTPEFAFVDQLMASRPTKVYQAGGRTFAMSGLMSAFQQVGLKFITDTEDDRAMMRAILSEATILVRAMPETRLPGSFYAAVASIPMRPLDARLGGDSDFWDLVGNEVTRPELGILVAVYSYDLFKAYLDTLHPPTPGTYNDAAAQWATYIAALRNPPAV